MTDNAKRMADAVAYGRSLREESDSAEARAAANFRAYQRSRARMASNDCHDTHPPTRGKQRRGARRIKARRRLRRECLARQGYTCWYCGIAISDIDKSATLDHVRPISKGGAEFDIDNCVASCEPCNQAKGDTYPVDHTNV